MKKREYILKIRTSYKMSLAFTTILILGQAVPISSYAQSTVSKTKEIAPTFSDIAKKRTLPPGAPSYSEVSFSSRQRHPINDQDTLDTYTSAKAFFASRLEWVYTWDKIWIHDVKKQGYTFGGALNAMLPDKVGSNERNVGRIIDSTGKKVEAPWMIGWRTYWGCANSPEYRQSFLAHAKILIDAGVDFIQVDDAKMNIDAQAWGGCYCLYCKAKAKALGKSVRDIQSSSVVDFFTEMRQQIDTYAGHRVPMSCNNSNANWNVPYYLFDFGAAELGKNFALPQAIYSKYKETEKLGKAQIFTSVSEDIQQTRRVIATSYACGGHTIVPWDVYLKSTPTGSLRYFGKPEEFADLYGFVHANAAIYDDHEDAFATGKGIKDERYPNTPVVISGGNGNIYAFVRAVPHQPETPVAIHLVDWNKNPAAFQLTLDMGNFSNKSELVYYLTIPAAYNRRVYRRAASTKKYTTLSQVIPLAGKLADNKIVLDIPALTPYGIVVIKNK